MTRLALVALLVVAAGCGGAKTPNDAADLVPPSAVGLVMVQRDLGPLPGVLRKFPVGARALASVRSALALRDTAGPQLEYALFRAGGMVGFTQPADDQAFLASLPKQMVHARIRGWTVFTDKPALLDLVRHHKGKLTDQQSYKDAVAHLPEGTVARGYATGGATALVPVGIGVKGPRVKGWTAFAVDANHGVQLRLVTQSVRGPAASSELTKQIPAGAVLAFGFAGTGSTKLPKLFGFDLQAIVDALGNDAIGYVKAGLPFPEVTVASKPRDPEAALKTVAKLVRQLGRSKASPVPEVHDGVTLQHVALGSVDLYYGVFDGELVVSDSPEAPRELRSNGDKLNVPDLPDATNGWLYLDIERALPAAKAFARLANQTIPMEIEANLKPLRTLLVYGTRDGDTQSVVVSVNTG